MLENYARYLKLAKQLQRAALGPSRSGLFGSCPAKYATLLHAAHQKKKRKAP